MKLSIRAPAKINLGLRILRKNTNGFHEVETIYSQIGLFDFIELEDEIEDKIIFEDKTNLVYQAAKLIKERLNICRGVKITLEKHIPMGSGLGGGSSDAASVLKGLNSLWKLQLTQNELIQLGKEIGSDVAYHLVGGTKLEIQGGDKAGEFTDLGKIMKDWVVVCFPEIFIGSRDAYSKVEYENIGKNEVLWHNDFEIWTLKTYPKIAIIKETMLRAGVSKSLMSGKGSSVFGIAKNKKQGQTLHDELKRIFRSTYLVKPFYD
jgi:4-diphosphocytidyl-2-C-methyl-D-erythritol kinase